MTAPDSSSVEAFTQTFGEIFIIFNPHPSILGFEQKSYFTQHISSFFPHFRFDEELGLWTAEGDKCFFD